MLSPKLSPPVFPPLTPQDKTKFQRIFAGFGPVNGLLNGQKARNAFMKSRLPVEKLLQIWDLADTQRRGSLDASDFAIAMYLIQASMNGYISVIPTSLPPAICRAAGIDARRAGRSVASSLDSVLPFSPNLRTQRGTSSRLHSDSTGLEESPRLPARPLNTVSGASLALETGRSNAQPKWDVTSAEEAFANEFFITLDFQKKGYIEADVVVPFMSESKLDKEAIAQIWALADTNNDGRLTKDGFTVAMHLIQGKLSGKDIPASLPLTLVPPSIRNTSSQSPPSSHYDTAFLTEGANHSRCLQAESSHLDVQRPARMIDCGVCLDAHGEDDVVCIEPCAHTFCKQCIRSYISSKLEEQRSLMICPMCVTGTSRQQPSVITHTLARRIGMPKEEYETWSDLEMANVSVNIRCPKCKRSVFVDREEYEEISVIMCPLPNCSHSWCKTCQRAVTNIAHHSCDGSKELDQLVKTEGWRYCPGCKTLIQKDAGCNHMTCSAPGCNTHFCYSCGKLIIRSALGPAVSIAITNHFRDCQM